MMWRPMLHRSLATGAQPCWRAEKPAHEAAVPLLSCWSRAAPLHSRAHDRWLTVNAAGLLKQTVRVC